MITPIILVTIDHKHETFEAYDIELLWNVVENWRILLQWYRIGLYLHTPISYVFVRNMLVTPRHWYCHLNTLLHRQGTAKPAPFPIRFEFVLFFNQSIFIVRILVVLIRPYAY